MISAPMPWLHMLLRARSSEIGSCVLSTPCMSAQEAGGRDRHSFCEDISWADIFVSTTGQGKAGAAQFGTVVGVVVLGYVIAQVVISRLDPGLGTLTVTVVEASIIAVFAGGVVWYAILRPLRARGREQRFASKLHSALQMSATEASTYTLVAKALAVGGVTGRSRLLLADSSEAHLKAALDTSAAGDDPCTVVAPFDCPAIRRAQMSEFRNSAELDTCPWLAAGQSSAEGGRGAVCVPLNVVGRAIGVLQVTDDTPALPEGAQLRAVEAVAEHAGVRIGMLRVMERTHLQAATDPLTGLLNRRSLENQAADLFRGHTTFALAMGDLDHFKQLNDTHGHDAGDRALRVFARTLRSVLRSDDLVARFGGEEFVLIFPAQTVETATAALERVREALAFAVAAGTVPLFTASFGVASSADADSLEDLIQMADAALFQAKRRGRNRVVADRAEFQDTTEMIT